MYILTGNYTSYEYDGYDATASPVNRQMFHVFDSEDTLKKYILAEVYKGFPLYKFSELSNVKIYKLAGEVSYQKAILITLS